MGTGGLEVVHDLEIIHSVEIPKMSSDIMNLSLVLVLNPSHSSGNC